MTQTKTTKKTVSAPKPSRGTTVAKTTPLSKPSKKFDLKQFALDKKKSAVRAFDNIKNRVVAPRKKAKKLTKAEKQLAKEQRNRAILGIGQLLVVVSIAYSTSVIFIGVNSLESKIALIPQVVFASYTLLKAFSKLYR